MLVTSLDTPDMSNHRRSEGLYWFVPVVALAELAVWYYSPASPRFRWFQLLASIVIVGCASYAARKISSARLDAQARKADTMSQLHLATAEALATAIDQKDQTHTF